MFRLPTVSCVLRNFGSSSCSYRKKMGDIAPVVYFRYLEPSNNFDVTFAYGNDVIKPRTFNLRRNIAETIENFSSRLQANIDKARPKKRKIEKKSEDSVALDFTPTKVDILQENKNVEGSMTCQEVFFSGQKDLRISIESSSYDVVINPPWIVCISIPQALMVGSYAYPSKLEILFGCRLKSTFTWYKSKTGQNWEQFSTSCIISITEDLLGYLIKLVCVPSNGDVWGPEAEAVSNAKIKEGTLGLPFLLRHKLTSKPLPPRSFRVVSYNILADVYAETEAAKTELFPYCPPSARNIDYRKQLYIREIIGYNADIICLQECDTRIFRNDLTNVLIDHEGVMSAKSGSVAEGIATFYSKRKFRLLETKVLPFGEEVDKNPLFHNVWDKIKHHEYVRSTVKERSTVLHALVLQCLDSDDVVVVGNTHLYFHPIADHIRLIQAGMAVLFLQDIMETYQNNGKKTTLLFCGDMNSTPDCGLYLLMTEKKAPSNLKDWHSDPDGIVEGLEFTQPFEMKSAYGAPRFTNFTEKFSGCLDYIYYQSDVLKLLQTVPIPEEGLLRSHTALPSIHFPSDHVSLIADFTWDK